MSSASHIGGRTSLLHAAAIVLITLVTYSGSFDGAFVSDDVAGIRDNARIASLAPANIRTIFTTFDDANYIPLKVLSLAVDRSLWGPEPTGYHVTNLILHIGCALLVYSILVRLGLVPLLACLVAALWAVHPLQVESVAWISERKNVLAGFFFFAAFRVYLEYAETRRVGAYAVFVTLYLCALLSKLNTAVLPALCLAYEWIFRRRLDRRAVVAEALPLALAVAVAWYNLAGNPIHGEAWHGGSRIVTWFSSAVVLLRYLRAVVLPTGLEPLYDVPLRGSPLEPVVALSLVVVTVLVLVTGWLLLRRRHEAFWLLWFGITLAPMLNVALSIRSMMQDRFMHLALLGPLALAASVVGERWRRAAVAAACLAVLACAWLSYRQVEIWSDAVSLWGASAVRRPLLGGDPVYRRPDYEERVAFVQRALTEQPSSGALHNNLGELYYEQGRLPDALAELETANRLLPDDPVVLLNLGRVYMLLQRASDAEVALARAIELRPYMFMNYLYRTRLHLFVDQDVEKARAALEAGLRVEPDAERGVRREREALARLERARTSSDSP